jgi:hypothetical protein
MYHYQMLESPQIITKSNAIYHHHTFEAPKCMFVVQGVVNCRSWTHLTLEV